MSNTQMPHRSGAIFLRPWSWRRVLSINLAVVPPVTVVTGLAVHVLIHGFGLGADGVPPLTSIMPAFVYTLIMLNLQFLSGYVAFQKIPITSTLRAAAHVGIQSFTTLLSFLLATSVVFLIHGILRTELYAAPGLPTMGIIAIVAFLASVICNTAFYLFYLYRRARLSEQAALYAELQALKAQINPHFLFNSLNSIAALIRSRPAEAEAVTEHLAELFRYSLQASRKPTVTLRDELQSVKTYLEIERVRFRDRMRVEIEVDETLLCAELPGLVLQPLVENAVKYGVSATDGTCLISVDVKQSGPRVVVEVTDTGPGFPDVSVDEILERGTGLSNVRQRLFHHFGPKGTLEIIDHGVRISFPLSAVNADSKALRNGTTRSEKRRTA